MQYSVTNFCKHNERLNPALSRFSGRSHLQAGAQPGVLQVVWVSDSTVPLHGCLCCTDSALCWSPLLLSAHSAATACVWLCSAGFCMSISCSSSWGLCRLHDSACTFPPTPGEIMYYYFSLALPTHEINLNSAISLWIKNKLCCLSSSKRRCFHSWLRRNWSVVQLLLFLHTELVISVKIGCITAVDYSFMLYRYLQLLVWYYFNLGHYRDPYSSLFSSLPWPSAFPLMGRWAYLGDANCSSFCIINL